MKSKSIESVDTHCALLPKESTALYQNLNAQESEGTGIRENIEFAVSSGYDTVPDEGGVGGLESTSSHMYSIFENWQAS